MVRLIALKDHNIDGSKRYKKGDVYLVSESTARLLVQAKYAKRDSPTKGDDKGRYNRKDMRAKD